MGMVAAAPAVAASASTERASSGDAPSAIALLKALVAGASASTMVLSPSRAAPSCWTPARAASSAADRRGQVHVGGVSQRLSGPAERRAVERAGGAADLGDQGVARQGQDGPGRRGFSAPGVQRAEHGGEAAGQVDAMIGVADRRVQLGQVVAVGLDDPGGRHDPGPEDSASMMAP